MHAYVCPPLPPTCWAPKTSLSKLSPTEIEAVLAHELGHFKHKHIVRYYNSWVENGRVYLQNEFCEGGSLANRITEHRASGKKFTECELRRMLVHVAKGLQ